MAFFVAPSVCVVLFFVSSSLCCRLAHGGGSRRWPRRMGDVNTKGLIVRKSEREQSI